LWGWAAISRGARAISYYAWYPMSSGYESNGYGMIDLDGTITDRARIAGDFAGVVGRNAALFAPLRPHPSHVAILYNRLSYLVGGNTVAPGTVVRNSMLGIYRALFEQNIQADFIHPDEVLSGAASKYDVVYLSYPVMLQQPVVEALKGYVKGGGTLISEARPAWNDERGIANPRIPGGGLDQTFGARESALRSAESITFTMEKGLDGPLASLAGRTFNGLAFAEHLDVGRGTRVLARFPGDGVAAGSPAIADTRQGSGRAILIGTFPSAAFEQDPEKMHATGELLQRLIASAGVAPEISIDGGAGRVEARFLESSDAIVLIAINHGDAAERVTFRFGPDVPEAIWQNMETGAAVNFVQGAEGPTYAHTFAARDVMVLVRGKRLR
jgi:beta-galactosidase